MASFQEIRTFADKSAFASPSPLRPSGFTLIEVLVAMTVLSIMVLMVANIFQSSSAAWNIGTQKADMNTAARAALDYMVRELSSAVAGPIDKVGSGGANYLTFRLEQFDDIRFLALANEPDASQHERAVRGVFFWLNSVDAVKYSLRVGRKANTLHANPLERLDCYSLPSAIWHGSHPQEHSVMISNVLSLSFYVYMNEADLIAGHYIPDIGHTPIAILNELPLCVDIAIALLSNDDMQRYNQLSVPADKDAFEARNSKVYSTRVSFPNRQGYGAH